MYELWDGMSGNLLGEYQTQDEALIVISTGLVLYGPEWLNGLYLGKCDAGGALALIADSDALAALVAVK